MVEQIFNTLPSALSSSAAVTETGTVTPEQLSEVAALLPLLAFPFLPPQRSHQVVIWSSCLNLFSYFCNVIFWLDGYSWIHLPYWVVCVTILSLMLGWWAVFDSVVFGSASYSDWRLNDLSWSSHVVCSLILFHFAGLGGYFVSFEHLLVWRNIALLLVWCTISVLGVPAIFARFSTPVSTLFFNFTTRRLPLIFWLDRFAVKINAEVEAGESTKINKQSDPGSVDLGCITVESTENEAKDKTSQGARKHGEPDTRRYAEQEDDEENYGQQYFERRLERLFERLLERPFEQHWKQHWKHWKREAGIKHKIVEEKRTPWGIAALGFVCVSVPVLLVLQYIALN